MGAGRAVRPTLVLGFALLAPPSSAGTFYVAPDGDDANDCLTHATRCATVAAALKRPEFVDGDVVRMAEGTYTDPGDQSGQPNAGFQMIHLTRDVALSGGWDAAFAAQTGYSTVECNGPVTGVRVEVNLGVVASIDRLVVQKCVGTFGQGLFNYGTLTITNSIIRDNAGSNGGGISNHAELTLRDSTVSGNRAENDGGGIYNSFGTLTIERSAVVENVSEELGGGIYVLGESEVVLSESVVAGNRSGAFGPGSGGGGVWSEDRSIVTIDRSSIHDNATEGFGGGVHAQGALVVDNSTISRNRAYGSGGLYVDFFAGVALLSNVSVAGNTAVIGGGVAGSGLIAIRNTLVAGNEGRGADCAAEVNSFGYNLVGDTAGCRFFTDGTDVLDVFPRIGAPVGVPAYVPLLPGSPAVDAGNPSGCEGSDGPLDEDQRGASRVGRCDIGAYEQTAPGPPAVVLPAAGSRQTTAPRSLFEEPLRAAVLDDQGTPVPDVTVAFEAPSTGPGAAFGSGPSASAATDEGGVAAAPRPRANEHPGAYVVEAGAAGVAAPAAFELENHGWYVAPSGDDAAGCLGPASACATIGGVLAKPEFMDGDTILVGAGVYASASDPVVDVTRDVRLLGGWEPTFTLQDGSSVVDGEGARRAVKISERAEALLERFTIRNGYRTISDAGGGLWSDGFTVIRDSAFIGGGGVGGGAIVNFYTGFLRLVRTSVTGSPVGGIGNEGYLDLLESDVSGNQGGRGGGIDNTGGLSVRRSTISGNRASQGGAVWNAIGARAALSDSTISGNVATSVFYAGGGIGSGGVVILANCTITGNASEGTGGGGVGAFAGYVAMSNTILAGNAAANGPDCDATVYSLGFNLLGDDAGFDYYRAVGDRTGSSAAPLDPRLSPLHETAPGVRVHAPRSGSPAIDAGDPDPPGSTLFACGAADQRGAGRPLDGDGDGSPRCDIGAYELARPASPLAIDAEVLPQGEVGAPYLASLDLAGGTPPFDVSVTKGSLPAGLLAGGDGAVSGIPSEARMSVFTLRVTDILGASTERRFAVKIVKAVHVVTSALPRASAGRAYAVRLKAMLGKKPFAWDLTGGSLPPGVTLDAATGKISGVPGAAGAFPMTIRVTDALGGRDERSVTLTVR